MNNNTLNIEKINLKLRSELGDQIALVLLVFGLFFLPVSTSLANGITISAVVILLLGKQFNEYKSALWQLPIVKISFILMAVVLLRVFNNPDYPLDRSWHTAIKYSHKLLEFIIFLPFFANKKNKQYTENAFIVSVLSIATLNIIQWYGLVDFPSLLNKPDTNELLSPIPWSISLSLASYFLLNRFMSDISKNWLSFALWLYLVAELMFINIERTGIILFIFLTGYSLLIIHKKINKYFLLLIITLLVVLLTGSPSIKSGIHRAHADISQYQAQGKNNTSIGLRLSYIKYSWQLIKEKPFLGYGTGNFAYAYEKTGGPKMSANELLGDPHNSYVNITVQLGILGLGLFLLWFLSLFQCASYLPKKDKLFTYGLLFAFMLTSLSVSAFLRTRICSLYLILLAAQLGQYFLTQFRSPEKRIRT